MADAEQPDSSHESLSRAAHREQVWAAMVRAVLLLLEDTDSRLSKQLDAARLGRDLEREELLERRLDVLAELRRQIASPPPGEQC